MGGELLAAATGGATRRSSAAGGSHPRRAATPRPREQQRGTSEGPLGKKLKSQVISTGPQPNLTEVTSRAQERSSSSRIRGTQIGEGRTNKREEEELDNKIQQARIHLQLLETEEKMRRGGKGVGAKECNNTASSVSPQLPGYILGISEGHQHRQYTRGREGSVHLEGSRQPLLPTLGDRFGRHSTGRHRVGLEPQDRWGGQIRQEEHVQVRLRAHGPPQRPQLQEQRRSQGLEQPRSSQGHRQMAYYIPGQLLPPRSRSSTLW